MAKMSSGDFVIVACILYALFDLAFTWSRLGSCSKPLNVWLLGSYVLLAASRVAHAAGRRGAQNGSDMLLVCSRQADVASRVLFWLTWLVVVPLFTAWSVIGSFWLADVRATSPRCLPAPTDYWFILAWQVLSYGWIVLHAALAATAIILEMRERLARSDSSSSPAVAPCVEGLAPAAISAMPGVGKVGSPEEDQLCGEDCPICLCELAEGDEVRRMRACGHTFHRSCIDLWLVRCANCPLCKSEVCCESSTKKVYSV